MQSLSMVRGTISPEWADQVNGDKVWTNSYAYEPGGGSDSEGLRIFDYSSIADLSILCTERVFTPQAIGRLASFRSKWMINLAPNEPARLTSTGLLLAAYLESPDHQDESDPLRGAAHEGIGPKLREDGNDTWIIPAAAISLVSDHPVTEIKLPHQG